MNWKIDGRRMTDIDQSQELYMRTLILVYPGQ